MSMLQERSIEEIEVDDDWRDEVIEVGKSEYLRGLEDAKKAVLKLTGRNWGFETSVQEIEKLIEQTGWV